jgi:hypothetical protein
MLKMRKLENCCVTSARQTRHRDHLMNVAAHAADEVASHRISVDQLQQNELHFKLLRDKNSYRYQTYQLP